MKNSGGRWYVSVLTALAAVAMIWGISEQTSSSTKQTILIATERCRVGLAEHASSLGCGTVRRIRTAPTHQPNHWPEKNPPV